MMTWKLQILTVAVLLAPAIVRAAEGQNATAEESEVAAVNGLADFTLADFTLLPERGQEFMNGSPQLVRGQSRSFSDSVARFGWWGVETQGSPTKVGEWMGLNSSAFFDMDGITSDGTRTIDFSFTGTEDETSDARLYYFGPRVSAKVDYQRFIHRLDHDPLDNFLGTFPSQPRFDAEEGNLTNPGSLNRTFLSQDLNVGDDYAIRVQELDVQFKGDLTENLKWGLNLWGMRKNGERQSTAQSHCFNSEIVDTGVVGGVTGPGIPTHPPVDAGSRACHVLSQTQKINWLTTEIEPVLQADFGAINMEYSHTTRAFSQDDELSTRNHTSNAVNRSIGGVGDGVLPVGGTAAGSVVAYGVVPENVTNVDRLKFGVDMTDTMDFYAAMYTGNTHNKNRETDRRYSGIDLRLSEDVTDSLSVTGYARWKDENNQLPDFFAADGTEVVPAGQPDAGLNRIVHPWNRQRTAAGFDAVWNRSESDWFTLLGGYEYSLVNRDFTDHETAHPDQVFTQENTTSNEVYLGTRMWVSRDFKAHINFTHTDINDPMYAAHEPNGFTNSSLPTQTDIVTLRGTWTPSYRFLLTGTLGIESLQHSSERADFKEDNYPASLSGWYSVTQKWSLSGGLAYYSNAIGQDITLGDQTDRWVDKGSYWRRYLDPATTRWSYQGTSQVVNLGSRYAHNSRLSFVGDFEWVRGENRFSSPDAAPYDLSPTGTPSFPVDPDWSGLGALSDVIVETTRFTAGADYLLSDSTSCYLRYVFYDYQDDSAVYNSGTTHMVLGGMASRF